MRRRLVRPYGTTERTYLEQARQTVLGGARESMLFCYGSLLEQTGPKNIETLRQNIPELLAVAEQVGRRQIVGVAAYKPANSHPENEQRVFDFVGMLGLPLGSLPRVSRRRPGGVLFGPRPEGPRLAGKAGRIHRCRQAGLLTDGLAKQLSGKVNLSAANVHLLPVQGDPK